MNKTAAWEIPSGLMVLLLAGVVIFSALPVQAVDGASRLQEARQSLKGEHKDTDKAKKLLLEIVQSGKAENSPETLVWAYIYLGYIDDLALERQSALGWYEKALAVEGALPVSLSMAEHGKQRPLTWIRHLDSEEAETANKAAVPPERKQPAPATPAPKPIAPKRDSKAYVTKTPPEGLTLAKNLSVKERRENFQALWSILNDYYADFELKSIDWSSIGKRYDARLDSLTGDDDFYRMMFQLVNELKDAHSWIANYSPPILGLAQVPEMPIDMFEGRPFVVGGARAGWEVLSVDGMMPAAKMEELRPYLQACSSERAFRRNAGQSLLAGKAGDPVSVTLRSLEGKTETISVKRGGRGPRPPAKTVAINLTRQQFVHFGRYPSGLGYIKIESFMGRKEIDQEFDRALEALRETQGLIVDIRDNSGGLGHEQIVGRFLRKRTLIGIDHTKNGPRHKDIEGRKYYLEPSGKWQYMRPVALLVNDVTGSASDLFASELRSAVNVVTVGTTTHGNVGSAIFGVLPCGLVVRVSNGYVGDAKDRPIELNGNVPDIIVEPSIQDFLNGKDPVLERATEVLLKKVAG